MDGKDNKINYEIYLKYDVIRNSIDELKKKYVRNII